MKRKSKWFTSLMPIFLVFILLVSACSSEGSSGSSSSDGSNGSNGSNGSGGDDEEKIELTMTTWGNPGEIKVIQRALDAYEEKNPNVTVKLIPAPGDTYQQKLLTQLQGGEAPDVFYVGGESMAPLIATNRIAELTDFLGTSESYVKEDEFAEGLWGAAKKDGKIYGLTVDSNPLLLYYNKKVLEEAGIDPNEPQKLFESGDWNWNTFQEITTKIKNADKYGFVVDNWWGPTFSWIWTNGGKMYDEEGNNILAENEKAQEAFKYLATNIKNGNFTYGGSLPKGQGADAMFMSNQVGFVGAGRWLTPMFSENESLEFDYVPWPSNTGKQIETAGVATAYMAVTKDSKHLEEAMKFASFYTSKEGQTVRLDDNGNAIPSIHSADSVIENAKIPEHASYLKDARDIGISEANQLVIPGLDTEINTILDLMFLGQKSPDEAIAEISKTAEEMIAEYRAE
jgi:multiple sugar transport system substrate-binding protein